MKPWALLGVVILSAPIPLRCAVAEPTLSIGGLLFGDVYAVPSHHQEQGDGSAGLVLRRGYLTFNTDLSKNWFGRFRFELNQSGQFETYSFKTSVKDLFVGRKLGRQSLLLGLSPTPTFDLIESAWAFRYLARTPLDLQGVASRDNGIAIKGPINASGTFSYRAMLGLEADFGNETDDGRRWMGALNWKPSEHWTIDLYTDHETLSGPRDRTTWQIFAAYQSDSLSWGTQYSRQDRGEDPPLELASAFAHGRVGQKTRLVGRIDRLLEPSPKGNDIAYLPYDPSARATTLIGGVEFQATPHIFITPNTVVTYYDRNKEGLRPKTDVYVRLTLFIDFE
ncbi:MAG: hypothetical protein HKN57_10030 [Xanthomonadales bacterium]|nr:hypothetical protein [Gammaproteobacteria bacterium]MBT8054224.1 hypothetical protein [Gammaproteobacteria bacterium]NND57583.1 hypothetical protein [Xanthomonadales bacterium]NNK51307.1 hypothetical protein [Xanthomonadales bacterium]